MSNTNLNRQTVFDSPLCKPALRKLTRVLFKLLGWQVEGTPPDLKKYVVIGAPHTSNWDFPLALGLAFHFEIRLFWLGKDALFRWPLGSLMRWLGGIAVNRATSHNLVEQAAETLRTCDEMVLGIPPEGTRQRVSHWKTGFYYIALQAQVPIALAFIDFKRKTTGFGPTFTPSGDLEKDMTVIRAFYAPIQGKYANQSGSAEISLKP